MRSQLGTLAIMARWCTFEACYGATRTASRAIARTSASRQPQIFRRLALVRPHLSSRIWYAHFSLGSLQRGSQPNLRPWRTLNVYVASRTSSFPYTFPGGRERVNRCCARTVAVTARVRVGLRRMSCAVRFVVALSDPDTEPWTRKPSRRDCLVRQPSIWPSRRPAVRAPAPANFLCVSPAFGHAPVPNTLRIAPRLHGEML